MFRYVTIKNESFLRLIIYRHSVCILRKYFRANLHIVAISFIKLSQNNLEVICASINNKQAYAGQLNIFTHLRAVCASINNKQAYAGQLNIFTHLRALLVLHAPALCGSGPLLVTPISRLPVSC